MEEKYIDLGFLTFSEKYLHLVKSIFQQSIFVWNISHYSLTNPTPEEESLIEEKYEKNIQRSDFSIMIPTLFVMYHWFEVLFKGLLRLKFKSELSNLNEIEWNNHSLTYYFNKVLAFSEYNEVKLLEKYINIQKMDSFIGCFLKINHLSNIDKFYEFLKYPTNKDELIVYNYTPIHHKEEIWIIFMKQAINDIDLIIPWMVSAYYKHKWS